MRVIFWQDSLSPHQAAHIRGLLQLGVDVLWVAADKLSSERLALGWHTDAPREAVTVLAPSAKELTRLIDTRDAVHIFSGVYGTDACRYIGSCLARGSQVAVMSEAPDLAGMAGVIRRGMGWLHTMPYRSRLSFALAIGSDARKWFEGCAIPRDRIFDYGYFVEPGQHAVAQTRALPPIVFVGQCIPRKRLDLLLVALSRLTDWPWSLDVIGDGVKRREWMALAGRLGIGARVRWHGVLRNETATQRIASARLLVLTSAYDGWGAVINEALWFGVPVICSNHCGSRVLVREDRGQVFRSGSADDLVTALHSELSRDLDAARRKRIAGWTRANVSGGAAAKYLLEIVANPTSQHLAPWLI